MVIRREAKFSCLELMLLWLTYVLRNSQLHQGRTWRKQALFYFLLTGIFQLEDSSLLELMLNSKCSVVKISAQGELIYHNNHTLDFIVNGG